MIIGETEVKKSLGQDIKAYRQQLSTSDGMHDDLFLRQRNDVNN